MAPAPVLYAGRLVRRKLGSPPGAERPAPTDVAGYGTVKLRHYEKGLRPYRRRLDLHPARAPHQEQLEIDVFVRAVRVGLGAHADQAVAQPALQRTEALP